MPGISPIAVFPEIARFARLRLDQVISKNRIVLPPVLAAHLVEGLPGVVQRVGIKGNSSLVAFGLAQFLDVSADDLHGLGNAPVVVLAELLQTNDAGSRHGRGAFAAVVGELSQANSNLRIVHRFGSVFGTVRFSDVLDCRQDDLTTDLQPAVDGAAQSFGLHDHQTQVVPPRLPACHVVPATVLRLRVGDQLECPVQNSRNLRIVRHAIGLPQDERRQTVVVHISPVLSDVQQPGGLCVTDDVFQCPIDHVTVLASAWQVAVRQERQCAQTNQTQIVGIPVPLSPLIVGQPLQSTVQRQFTAGRDLPLTLAECGQRLECREKKDQQGVSTGHRIRSGRAAGGMSMPYGSWTEFPRVSNVSSRRKSIS